MLLPAKLSTIGKRKLLHSIPKNILAYASYICHAYTRALKYFETYLRHQYQNKKKYHHETYIYLKK